MLKFEDDNDVLPGMPEPAPLPPEPPHDDIAQLALQLRCEHCKVMPGHWCRTKSGHGAANLHAARLLVVQSVFWLGFSHGFDAGLAQRVAIDESEPS